MFGKDKPRALRKFRNKTICLQRYYPPWRVRNFSDSVDIPPGGIVEATDDGEAVFWEAGTKGKNAPLEEIFSDEKPWVEKGHWGLFSPPK